MKWFRLLAVGLIASTGLPAQTPGTALVRHAPEINGTLDGSVQQMLGEPATFAGNAAITGDWLVPGTPDVRVNGSPSYGGVVAGAGDTAPSSYTLTIGGSARLRFLRSRTDPIAWPSAAAATAPTGTRSVTLAGANDTAGDFATLRNLTLNGSSGIVAVPAGAYGVFTANASGSGFALGQRNASAPAVYHFERVDLNGGTELRVLGPVIVTVGQGVQLGGLAGASERGDWLQLKLAAGALALQGNAQLHAVVHAPTGAVTLAGSSRLIGSVLADRLEVGGGTTLQVVTFNRPPTVALTAPASGATFVATSTITLAADATDPDGPVAKVEFYAGATKLGEDSTAPFTFAWTNVPAGNYSLHAVAIDGAGASAASASVPITVTPGEPPTVTLLAPTTGGSFVSSIPIGLAAAASDPDGTVVRVEFYQGALKIAEAFAPGFTATWLAAPGSYLVRAKAYDNTGLTAESGAAAISVRAGLPYITDFESLEGYTLGSLAGQQAWTVPQGVATVTNAAAFSQAWSVSLAPGAPPARVAQSFVPLPGQEIVFVDFFAKPVADADVNAASLVESGGARVALLRSGGTGTIHVFDGTGQGGGTWRSTGVTKPLAADGATAGWLRLTLRQDYPTQRWDLAADGTLIAINLGFRDAAPGGFATFALSGHATATTRLDYFFAGTDNPLFADADRDGIDDAYEAANGLNPQANDRAGDVDGDGLSNLEEFMFGTRANLADTDGDSMPDGWEVKYGLNPKLNDGAGDLDGDGVSNAAEFAQGRNPTKGAIPDTTGVVGLVVFQPL